MRQFPSTGLLDSFNRANEDPLSGGGTWLGTIFDPVAGDTQLQVVSNAVMGRTTTSENYWAVQTFGPNSEVWITVITPPPDQGIALYTNLQTPGTSGVDGYFFVFYAFGGGNFGEIYRVDNDVATQLGATLTIVITAGDKYGFSVVGGVLTGYQNTGTPNGWAAIMVRSDATYAIPGYIGVSIDRAVAVIDDFGGGTSIDLTGYGSIVFRNRLYT